VKLEVGEPWEGTSDGRWRPAAPVVAWATSAGQCESGAHAFEAGAVRAKGVCDTQREPCGAGAHLGMARPGARNRGQGSSRRHVAPAPIRAC
jgi:hypothetical protein